MENHISWDEYFMGIAFLSSMRSKDPSTKVGACIVSKDKKVLSLGYNGMPTGCDDEVMPWGREGEDPLDTKYPFVVHAELNAILNANKDIRNSKIYVTLYPCNECAKALVQAGVKEVIYYEDKYKETMSNKASSKIFALAGVKVTKYEGRKMKVSYENV